MTDYSKEPVVITEKADAYHVGAKVVINEFYLSHYAGVSHLKDVKAEIKKITSRPIKKIEMEKEDRRLYADKYGNQDTYSIIGLYIQYPNDKSLYLVSPFGYDVSDGE